MNTAQKVRLDKEAHPGLYCWNKRCLWRVVHRDGRVTPCSKHQRLDAVVQGCYHITQLEDSK